MWRLLSGGFEAYQLDHPVACYRLVHGVRASTVDCAVLGDIVVRLGLDAPGEVGVVTVKRPTGRPAGYEHYATFHPTFLYESLWCLTIFGVLLLVEKRHPLRRGQVFALYVALYTLGRVFFEWLRIDDATKLFGVRFNLMLSVALCVFGFAWFVWLGRRPIREAQDDPEQPPTVSPEPGSGVEI